MQNSSLNFNFFTTMQLQNYIPLFSLIFISFILKAEPNSLLYNGDFEESHIGLVENLTSIPTNTQDQWYYNIGIDGTHEIIENEGLDGSKCYRVIVKSITRPFLGKGFKVNWGEEYKVAFDYRLPNENNISLLTLKLSTNPTSGAAEVGTPIRITESDIRGEWVHLEASWTANAEAAEADMVYWTLKITGTNDATYPDTIYLDNMQFLAEQVNEETDSDTGFKIDESGRVIIDTTDIIQDAVLKYPGETTFLLKSGVHRMQKVTPKTYNTFVGEDGAVLNGSRLLSNWTHEGDYWTIGGQDQENEQLLGNWCQEEYPRCHYPEDLFRDDKPLVHRESKSKVTNENDWYFDQNADKVYIKFDPTGYKVEIGVKDIAFGGSARNVTLKNIIVEKYASPTQKGAIGENGCVDWIIEDCEARLNHGVGIHFSGNTKVRNCKIHNNGQLGIKTKQNSNGAIVEECEIFENMYSPYWGGNEGGGSKFARTKNLILKNNYVHHNYFAGLWTDISNEGALIEGNICEYNAAAGIFHEISYDAIIRCNTLRYNNLNPLQHSGGNIFLSNSQNCKVYNNVIVTGAENDPNGITIRMDGNRVEKGNPKFYSNNNEIFNNDITFTKASKTNGLFTSNVGEGEKPVDNYFHHNTYHALSVGAKFFIWEAQFSQRDLQWIQSIGQETGSTIDVDLSTDKSVKWCNAENVKPEVSFLNVNEGDSIEMSECFDLRLALADSNGYLTKAYVQIGENKIGDISRFKPYIQFCPENLNVETGETLLKAIAVDDYGESDTAQLKVIVYETVANTLPAINEFTGLKFYPNPVTNNELFLESPIQLQKLVLRSITGAVLHEVVYPGRRIQLPDNLKSGVYLLEYSLEELIGVQKIMVK